MSTIRICDSTLRDGSHAKHHQFTVDEVARVVRALDAAGVSTIEVSHGDGLGGSSHNYGFSGTSEFELIETAVEAAASASIAVLLIPGIGVKDDLRHARDLGAEVVRVATHCTEADIAIQHIGLARELGMTTGGFLMMSHMIDADRLAQQSEVMASAGAQFVYVTDSAGALTPDAVRDRVARIRDTVPDECLVGFHGHENLSLSVANSLAAVEAGASWIDCTTCGLGAGAGNTPTEVFAVVCERVGITTGIDVEAMMAAAATVVRPLMLRPQLVDEQSLVLGYAGVYSSFMLHAQRAGERFGVSPTRILLAAGERKAVGGQEDWLIDIAAELAAVEHPTTPTNQKVAT